MSKLAKIQIILLLIQALGMILMMCDIAIPYSNAVAMVPGAAIAHLIALLKV